MCINLDRFWFAKLLNAQQMFVKLFMLAKLPTEMSPSQHRKIQQTTHLAVPGDDTSTTSGTSSASTHGSPVPSGNSPRSIRHRMVSLRRRLSDACGAVAVNARRPSIRTDLLTLQQVRRTLGQSSGSSTATTAAASDETGSLTGDLVRSGRDVAAKCSIQ